MSRLLTALLIATLAVIAQPSPAKSDPDLLPDLGLTSTSTSGEESPQEASGRTYASDRVLRRGCRTYRFSYEVDVPSRDWELTTWIVDRRGKGVASHFFGPGLPKADTASFKLCRAATVPGKFRIRARLFWYDEPTTPIKVDVPVTRFRLARP
ncbi:hypothetical protein [Nocardioides piscis]|uniref:Uncharacterized protein n=1 Tax=Nocardioides piscis TaxID=2714938 RepID=A0A6G7YGW5_9ACTN|nr:hypothetical protein [Nocardioides piscis]QIK76052.1 hypothetical protein G7071_12030 [Nocardioides piscis]